MDGTSVPYFPLKIKQQGNKWKVYNPVDQENYWVNDYGHYLFNFAMATTLLMR